MPFLHRRTRRLDGLRERKRSVRGRAMVSNEHNASDGQLLRRIRSEYFEMPGMRLSREQAQRLWGLDAPTCARLLECLVEAGFLQRGPDGRYGPVSENHMHREPLRMAKADINLEDWGRQAARRLPSAR